MVLIQALATHVQQLVALPDELRASTIERFRQLCTSCGCINERELARFLATERKPRRCPIARLLRACGQLGMDIKLPDCITTGKAAREVSWFALLEHIRTKVAQDDPPARVDLSGQDDPVLPESGSSPRATSAWPAASAPAVPHTPVVHSHNGSRPSGPCAVNQDLACVEGHCATHN